MVSVGGIDQRPTTDWTISSANGGTITFASAPPNGAPIVVRAFVGTGTTNGNAAFLQGRAMANTEPTSGEAIIWDSIASTWKPGTPPSGSDIGGRAWDAAATYSEGDLVATSQRETWICIQDDNVNHDPTEAESTWWAPLPSDAISLQLRPVATTAPLNYQPLVYDAPNGRWTPGFLSTVNFRGEWDSQTTYVQNDAVKYFSSVYVCANATALGVAPNQPRVQSGFVPYFGSGPLNNAAYLQFTDVSTTPPSINDFLKFDGQAWVPSTVTNISGYPISISQPMDPKMMLVFDGTSWVNTANVIGKINEIITWINSNGGSITPL